MKFSSLVPSVLAATGVAVAMSSFSPANAAFLKFSLDDLTGSDSKVDVTLDDSIGSGDIKVTVDVDTDVNLGDLRGIWFNVADESILPSLDISNPMPNLISASQFQANSVNPVGDVQLDGERELNPCLSNPPGSPQNICDGGIEIGTAGIGNDDVQSIMWTFFRNDGQDLTLDDFFGGEWAARVTSVGPAGSRGGSSKLSGVAPTEAVPEPLTILGSATALGIGGLLKREQSKKNNKNKA